MPLDYATYMWLLYRERVADASPQRLAHEHHADEPRLPEPDQDLIDTMLI